MFHVSYLYFSFPVCTSQMWCNQHHISTKRVFHTLETLGWRGTISTLAISRGTTNAILRNQMILIMQSDHNFLVLDKHAVLLVKLIPQLILWQWSCLRECIINVMDFHFFMHMFDSFLQPHIPLIHSFNKNLNNMFEGMISHVLLFPWVMSHSMTLYRVSYYGIVSSLKIKQSFWLVNELESKLT